MKLRRAKSSLTGRQLHFEALESREVLSTLWVTTAVDGARGSLREVVGRANSGDVIQFSSQLSGKVLALTNGEIAVSKSLTVQGTSQAIDAGGRSRIFAVAGPNLDVTFSGLTLKNGLASFDSEFGYVGGALTATDARLKLDHVTLLGNRAVGLDQSLDDTMAAVTRGGALFVNQTDLVMSDCVLQDNAALGSANTEQLVPGYAQGGALMALESHVTIVGGRFANNRAIGGSGSRDYRGGISQVDGGWGEGGAVFLLGADATFNDTALESNVARGGRGLDEWLVHVPENSQHSAAPGQGGAGAGGAIMALPSQTEAAFGSAAAGQTADAEPAGFGSPSAHTSALVLNRVRLSNNQANGGSSGGIAASPTRTSGGYAYGGAVVQGPSIVLSISGGTLSYNLARGGDGTPGAADSSAEVVNNGGDAFGGAIYSREFAAASANGGVLLNNRATGGNGADAVPGTNQEGGEPGYAQGGAWSLYTIKASNDPAALGLEAVIRNAVFSGNTATSGHIGQGRTSLSLHGMQGFAQGGALGAEGQIRITSAANIWSGNAAVASRGQNAVGGAVFLQTHFATNAGLFSKGDVFVRNTARGGDDPLSDSEGDYNFRDVAFGGAVAIYAREIRFERDQFQQNTAEGGNDTGAGRVGAARGGAVWIFAGADLDATFVACGFLDNEARGGRVLHADHLDQVTSDWTGGGAIEALNRPVVIQGGQFLRNRASALASAPGADAYGGAMHMNNYSKEVEPTATLSNVRLVGNQVAVAGGNVARGGAVAIGGLNALVDTGSTFIANTACNTGGGQAYGGAVATQGAITLKSTQFIGNTATAVRATPRGPLGQGYGGGIAFLDNPKGRLVQTRFVGNFALTAGNDTWGDYQKEGG